MPRSHILVEALDRISTGKVTELLVHVVGSRAGVVSEPDTEVLDLQRLLFVNLFGKKMQKRTRKIVTQEP